MQNWKPSVSCVMATLPSRRHLLPKAIEYFLRQDYSDRELLIIDEGPEPFPVGLLRAGVRLFSVPPGLSLGRKLNLGIPKVAGEVIVKLDDDDWYHPRLVSELVKALSLAPTGVRISTISRFRTLLVPEWKMMTSQDGWMLGNSLCFRKSDWEGPRFDEAHDHMADSHFLAYYGNRISPVNDPELCVVVRHESGHLWRQLLGNSVEDHFKRNFVPVDGRPEAFLPPEDAGVYRLLRARQSAEVPCDPDGYGMAEDSAGYLRKICEEDAPRRIVEIGTGPGVSHSVLSKWSPREAMIWSIDHVPEWQDEARKRLLRLGIARPEIRYITACIVDVLFEGGSVSTYDPSAFREIPGAIDLLLVDGYSRGPMLGVFLDRLSPNATILLDDLRRPSERAAMAAWVSLLTRSGRRFTTAIIPTERIFGEIRLTP
jgi:glycosyltransferase involved in cell wall biosynthesis